MSAGEAGARGRDATARRKAQERRERERVGRERDRELRERRRAERKAPVRLSLGALPVLAALAAVGLILVALGNNGAREGEEGLQPLFWFGLALIYGPIAFRLLSTGASREERIALVLTLGMALFVVKVLRSPLDYVRFDELGWWRATDEILRSGHAFGENPIAVATAGFPGLSTVTSAISELTGLSIFQAGLLVIGTARAVLMLALFLFLERVIGSARAAGIGVAVYACNPSFLYFDAQFGYESLALMIGAAFLLAALRWSDPTQPTRLVNLAGLAGTILILACMVTLTHHMTSFALIAFLAVWVGGMVLSERLWQGERAPAAEHPTPLVGLLDDPRARWLEGPALPAAAMGVVAAIWFVFVAGDVTVEELGGVFSRAFQSVVDLIVGSSESKALFSGAGQNEHFLARVLAVVSVVPLLALIPIGLLRMWRRKDRDPLRLALTLVAALYPLTLGLRLTLASSETSQRASEFVFVGVAFFAAIVITEWEWPRQRARVLARSLALATLATLSFIGGFIVGELQATRQPGPYLVGAEDRTVSPEGLAAARFADEELPPESRVFVDRTNATLLGSYGGVNPVFGRFEEVSLPRILFDEEFAEPHLRALRGQTLAYIVADARLSEGTPLIGYYVESDEPGAFTRKVPISKEALTKFKTVPGVDRIYTNGPIVIYDTTALLE